MGPEGLEKMLQLLKHTKNSKKNRPERLEGFPTFFQSHPMGIQGFDKNASNPFYGP